MFEAYPSKTAVQARSTRRHRRMVSSPPPLSRAAVSAPFASGALLTKNDEARRPTVKCSVTQGRTQDAAAGTLVQWYT